jgi:hypothetical protein
MKVNKLTMPIKAEKNRRKKKDICQHNYLRYDACNSIYLGEGEGVSRNGPFHDKRMLLLFCQDLITCILN